MKFKQPETFTQWTKEQCEERMEVVLNEIKEFNREINIIDGQINQLNVKRRCAAGKIGRKSRYLNQLRNQLSKIEGWEEL